MIFSGIGPIEDISSRLLFHGERVLRSYEESQVFLHLNGWIDSHFYLLTLPLADSLVVCPSRKKMINESKLINQVWNSGVLESTNTLAF